MMSKIVDIKLGQSLPGERWAEAADNLEQVFQMFAPHLLRVNKDGMGQQDAEEFMADATLALIALRYVSANPETCRFIPVPGKGSKEDGNGG